MEALMKKDLTLVCILNALYKGSDPVFILKKTNKYTKQTYNDHINKERKNPAVCPFLDNQDYDLVQQIYSPGIKKAPKGINPIKNCFSPPIWAAGGPYAPPSMTESFPKSLPVKPMRINRSGKTLYPILITGAGTGKRGLSAAPALQIIPGGSRNISQ